MNAHQILHLATVLLALALGGVSALSLWRTRKAKFALIAGAFFLLAAKEILLTGATWQGDDDWTVHIIDFAVLVLLAFGILK